MAHHREQVQRLLEAVLKRQPGERAAFLDGLAELEPLLRQEVESLIAAHEGDESGLEKPPAVESEGPSLDTAAVTRQKGDETQSENQQHIGPYRILREIGHGGMGVVYEAQQEEPVRRKVALKLIKLGMDTKQVIARFESERQALALMTHPNIASVYDAGTSEQGRPYFAMEYVHGIPVTEYCDKHRLTLSGRLELFLQLCEGVQHAHQKGIIHRDLKPSNILITIKDEKLVPKIIDFGVAKATSQRLTEKTVYTELGQLIGTPEYMSPEQAEMTGLDVDTRTDIYSLGVVLYELLVGAQPYDATELRRAGFDGLRRKIREEEPPKPSTRLSRLAQESTTAAKNRRIELRTLERELRGDLDWITMKALEKDRTRRYSSASEFAADIRRHLNHEPVLARPPSATYRLQKFVRRHRMGVAAGLMVLVALLLGIIGTTLSLVRAIQAERLATEEAAKARREATKTQAINEFLQDVLGSANPRTGLGRDVTLLEALDAVTKGIRDSFREQPEIEAAVRNTIGLTYDELARYQAAELQLRSALSIRQRTLPPNHPETVESLRNLAEVILHRDLEEAESLLRSAVSLGRTLRGTDRVQLARSLGSLAFLMTQKGEHQAAKELFDETLSLTGELLGKESGEYGSALHNIGVAAEYRGDFEGAEKAYREALEGSDGGVVSSNLAWVLYAKGDYDDAEAYFRDALAASIDMYGESHPTTLGTRMSIAMVRVAQGRLEGAEEPFRNAIKAYPDMIAVRGQRTAQTASAYGALLVRLGRFQEAEQHLVGAFDFMKKNLGTGDLRTQRTLGFLADLYESWGKPEKAAEYRTLLN